ncbi:MAG: hemolysin family protein, partial [Acidimicrobiia bacterium]|nr:hemolysin family protein [Acidimicrobiia bacterium]
IAFVLITVLHIVLGELAPKAFALLHPESTSRWVAAPLIAFTIATNPFIWVLNGAANYILRIFGMKPPSSHERVHRPEEIVMLVKQTHRSGQLAEQDVQLIEGVFEFTEKNVRDVMTPRTDVVGLDAETTVEAAVDAVRKAGRSRYPVYQGSLDDIIGIVHAKDLLARLADARYQKLRTVMRGDPLFVPGTREVEDLLSDMKRVKQHMAIVLDEYGGTAGIVTMEDILEEIVGLIFDEYDDPGEEDVGEHDGSTIPGSLEIDEANEQFDFTIDSEQHQTVGGYVFGQIGRLPRVGDTVTVDNTSLRVMEMDGRRIGTLQVIPLPVDDD